MRRFREFLTLSFVVVLGVVPASGQTVRSEPTSFPTQVAGFGTAIAIGGGEVFVSRTGASLDDAGGHTRRALDDSDQRHGSVEPMRL